LKERLLIIDCSTLIEPWHIFGLIAQKLLDLDRNEGSRIRNSRLFLHALRRNRSEASTVILLNGEELLRESNILWTIFHLPTLLVRVNFLEANTFSPRFNSI